MPPKTRKTKTSLGVENKKNTEKWDSETKSDSQSGQSDTDEEATEGFIRNSLLIASMKNMLEESLNKQNDKIKELINEAVSSAVAPLHQEITILKGKLQDKNNEVVDLNFKIELLDQASRRNILRIEGIPENKGESTDAEVRRLAGEFLGVELKEGDIDSSYRIGKPKKGNSRTILVNFATYQAKRAMYKNRIKLKGIKDRKIYVNEDLTKSRHEIAYQVRKLVKDNKFHKTWTVDGKIFLQKSADEKPQIIISKADFEKLQ
jgi:hypothetical protein